MYVDKETVISLLNDSDEGKYNAYLILLNEIPDDAVFTIVFHTTAVAVYMNSDGTEDMRFPLKFALLTKEEAEHGLEDFNLNEYIVESLAQDSKEADRHIELVSCVLLVLFFCVSVALVCIGYDIFIK